MKQWFIKLERRKSLIIRKQVAEVIYRFCARFNNMKQRCNNPKNSAYKYYGSRGIQVKFKTSREFILYIVNVLGYDTLEKFKELHDLVIHRINNDGHYEKGNIEFLTQSEHAVKHIKDWCKLEDRVSVTEYTLRVYHIHPDQKRLKKIHQKFHPGV